MLVAYHGVDIDGFCSAAIVNYFYKHGLVTNKGIGNQEILFHPMNHGDKYPFEKIGKNDRVYFLDFPPPNPGEDLDKLFEITKDIIWIDHHESSLEKFNDFDFDGHWSVTWPAACVLTWEYMSSTAHAENNKPWNMPFFVHAISDHDSWKHEIDKSDELCLGMLTYDGVEDPTDDIWEFFFDLSKSHKEDGLFDDFMKKGKTVQQYCKKSHEGYVKAFSYEMEWLGYKCIVCNRGMTGSYLFESLWDEEKYDLMIAYIFDGEKYIVSIYTTKTDKVKANDIAKSLGGGGHPRAAGFPCKILPWVPIN